MIRQVSIVPAILTDNKQDYRATVEKINIFTRRVQIDVTDGVFAQTQTLDITNVWWPKNWEADLHLMVTNPSEHLDTVLKLNPSLCILHAEANEDLLPSFQTLKEAGIKTGLALMPSTFPGNVKQYIDEVDHVLIFAGQLGVQGSPADMMQMEKIPLVRNMKPELEIGWDGGANMANVRAIAHADVDVINVGSAIVRAENPNAAFDELVAEIDKNGVVL
jgi:ribulose-phosphate 3-epimerase